MNMRRYLRERIDWEKLNWSRPDSPRPVLCAHCSDSLSEAPLTLWTPQGHAASFCERCTELVVRDHVKDVPYADHPHLPMP